VVVYVAEAHARDEWPVGESVSFCDAPKTLAERVALLQVRQARKKESRVMDTRVCVALDFFVWNVPQGSFRPPRARTLMCVF